MGQNIAIEVKIPAGLCGSCAHAQRVESSKGSTFVRCQLSFVDNRFPRYPTLPVIQCDGHEPLDDLPEISR
jgi:hypothetical protein